MRTSNELKGTVQNSEKGTERGQTESAVHLCEPRRRRAKGHVDHWYSRLKKRSYLDRDGKVVEIPDWQVRIKQKGKECWFNLRTPNQTAAARKAKEIYTFLEANGWEPTLAKFKPRTAPSDEITLEQFAEIYRKALNRVDDPPSKPTAERYLKSLFFICKRLNIRKLSNLTAEKVKGFVGDYLEAGRKEGRDEDSVKTSCNAILRNAGALFSKQMLSEYHSTGLLLVNPIAGQKLRRVTIKPYSPLQREALDAIWRDAVKLRDGDSDAPQPPTKPGKRWQETDLRKPHPEAYAILLLELGLGLRRNEADKAQWDWFFTGKDGRHFLKVQKTLYFTPKSKESREIPVEELLYQAIQETRSKVSSFVVGGRLPRTYSKTNAPKNLVYRCDLHHRALAAWLRTRHGITDNKPCHLLRKEFGSYVATSFGLFAAQRMLGHSSPAVTERFYAGLTQLPELNHAKFNQA
jgi:integrase